MARVTLKMIAEKAGTSVGTVDRALNNRKGVKEERRKLVLAVAEELGFQPNRLASALARKRNVHIGIVYPQRPSEFYHDMDRGIDKAERELQDYGVTIERIRYETQDPAIVRAQLAQIDPANFDGLAISSAGAGNISQVDHFVDSGLPVVTFNTDTVESRRLFYIGDNSRQSGMMGGEILGMLLGGHGNVLVFGNFTRTTPFIERFGGFCEFVYPSFPNIHMLPCLECFNNPELAEKDLINVLTNTPDISGVFCTGYSSTVGAINALKAMNRRDIRLVGYDLTKCTADALREGWCDALLYQDPHRQGHQAAHLLARNILEGWMPPRSHLHIDTRIIIKSNLDSHLSGSNQLLESNLER